MVSSSMVGLCKPLVTKGVAADIKVSNTTHRIMWEHFLDSEPSVYGQMILTIVGNVSKISPLTMDFYISNKTCYNQYITK